MGSGKLAQSRRSEAAEEVGMGLVGNGAHSGELNLMSPDQRMKPGGTPLVGEIQYSWVDTEG